MHSRKRMNSHQVICEINKGFYFKHTSPAIPTLLHYAIRIFEKTSGKSLSRRSREKLFDFCAALRLGYADVSIFHSGYMLPKTVLKARSKNSITADITVYTSLATNVALEKARVLAMLGHSSYQGVYTNLSKDTPDNTLFDIIAHQILQESLSLRRGFLQSEPLLCILMST